MSSAGARRYFERIGLDDFVAENYARIGTEIVAPGTPLGAGLTAAAAHDLGLRRGNAGRRLPDRCACRRHRRDRRPRRIGRPGRCLRPAGLHHGNVGLHHGDDGRALLRAGRLGALLFGHGAGLLAQRGRPVGRGRRDRSSAPVASGTCRGESRRRAARASTSSSFWSGGSSRAPAMPARRRCWRATFMCCRNFSATARPMPIPTRAR